MVLVAWWKLDDDTTDSVGSADLTLYNAPSYAAGKINNGLDLERSLSQYAGVGTSTRPLANENYEVFSISLWVKWESVIPDDATLSRNGLIGDWTWSPSSQEGFLFSLVKNSSDVHYLCLNTTDGTNYDESQYVWEPTIATWYHLAVVFEKSTIYYYIDSVLVWTDATPTFNSCVMNNDTSLMIGLAQVNTNYHDGVIDDVRIYDHALSQKEVYNLSLVKIAHWKMDTFAEYADNKYYSDGSLTKTFTESTTLGDFPIQPPVPVADFKMGGYWTYMAWSGDIMLSITYNTDDWITFSGWYMPYIADLEDIPSYPSINSAGLHTYDSTGNRGVYAIPTEWNQWIYFTNTIQIEQDGVNLVRIEDRGYDYYVRQDAQDVLGYWQNADFETGDFTGWTNSGCTISATAYEGSWACSMSATDYIEQDVSNRTVVTFYTLTFWARKTTNNKTLRVTVTYTDVTTSTHDFNITSTAYAQFTIVQGDLTSGKTIDKFRFENYGFLSEELYLDGIVWLQYGQDYAGTSGYWCNVMVEEKDHATPFVDGIRTGQLMDSSGYENHSDTLTTTCPQWTESSKMGKGCYKFLAGQFITTALDFSDNSPPNMTFSFWFRHDTGAVNAAVLGHRNSDNGFMFYRNSGDTANLFRFYKYYTDTIPSSQVSSVSTIFSVDTWYHCVAAYGENGEYAIYINGTELSSGTVSLFDYWDFNSQVFKIGTDGFGSYDSFSGYIDNIQIFYSYLNINNVAYLYKNRASKDNKGNYFV